jgi:hypothetical protein
MAHDIRAFPKPLAAVVAAGALLLLSGAACSSEDGTTEVRGATVTSEDPYRGGPDPATAEFRAGERAAYGTGP